MRNRSLSNAGWFYGKKRKIGKGNFYSTENQLRGNVKWCLQIISIICITYVQKKFKIRSFMIKAVIYKISNFNEIAQISHIHKNRIFQSIIGTFWDQPLLPYKFHGKDIKGIWFFNFCQLWAVKVMPIGYSVLLPWIQTSLS